MNPQESLQYVSTVCADYARTLPPSAQGPTVQAINAALSTLAGIVNPQPVADTGEPGPRLAAVPREP